MKKLATGAILTVLLTLPSAANDGKGDLDITAADGVNLKATYYDPGKPGPGVILLHQCNMDRKSWDPLASRLAAEGIHVLTLDYRGYEESYGADASREERRSLRQHWESDVQKAYEVLRSQTGVDTGRMGAGGASCGVNQSIQLARKQTAIKTLALLSGGTNDAGRDYIGGAPGLSVFGAASEEDTRAARAIRQIVELSKNPESKLVMYNNAGHGVPMFTAEPELLPTVVDWFKARLR